MMRKFAIGVAWTSAASWVEQLLNLAIFVLIARLIGTEQFGLAGMALAFVLMSETLIRSTLAEGIIERQSIQKGFLEATFLALLGMGTAITIFLAVLAPIAGGVYDEPLVMWLILMALPIIPLLAIAEVPTTLLRRRMAFDILAIRTLLGVTAGGVVGIYLALSGYGAWALIGQRLAITLVNCIFVVLAAKWVPKARPKWSDFSLVGGLGPRVVIIRGVGIITHQAPTIALGVFAGPQAVAVYALALRLVEAFVSLTVAPIKSVAQSAIAEMRRNGRSSAKFISELAQIIALVIFAGLAGLTIVGDPTIEIIFGEEWRTALPVLPWVCLAGCGQAITDLQESYLFALDRTKRWVRLILIETIIGTAMIVFASVYGPAATAAAYAMRVMLFFPFRTAIMIDPEKIKPGEFARSVILTPTLLALAMAVSVLIWRSVAFDQMQDLNYLIAAIAIGVVTYLLVLRFLAPGVLARAVQFIQSIRSDKPEFSNP